MPPRPFPIAFGIGTDIVHVPRIHRLLLKKSVSSQKPGTLHRFLRRFLTYREQQLFWERFKDLELGSDSKLNEIALHLAGRWAAKEAVIKAVQSRRLNFMEIEILRSRLATGRTGIYAVILDSPSSPDAPEDQTSTESADQDEPSERQGQVAKISISHDGEYATAVCLAAEGPLNGDVGGELAARIP